MEKLPDRPFSSLEEQVTRLAGRGLLIENESDARKKLLNNNYYDVINGYKDLFLQRDDKNKVKKPEVFIEGSRFSEIFSLYSFDQELRELTLQYLLQFETKFKSIVAYRFAEYFNKSNRTDPYAYLNIDFYSSKDEDFSAVLSTMRNLSYTLDQNTKSRYDNSIKFYVNKHHEVPIWVLIDYLTFGETRYLFRAFDTSLKETIAKDFSHYFHEQSDCKERIGVSELSSLLKCANDFRNVCAHGERLYNFKSHSGIKIRLFQKYFPTVSRFKDIDKGADVGIMLYMLTLVLSNKKKKNLSYELNHLFGKRNYKWNTINADTLLTIMGLSKDKNNRLLNL